MTQQNWIDSRIQYIKELSRPTEEQRLLVALYDERDNLTAIQKKKFDVLVKAERATEKAAAAKAELKAISRSEKDEARKLRNHNLFRAAGLLQVAELVDKETGLPFDTATLLGALDHIRYTLNNPAESAKVKEWKSRGEVHLKLLDKKSDKEPKNEATE